MKNQNNPIGLRLSNSYDNKEATERPDILTGSGMENNKYFIGMHDAIRAFIIDDLKGYLLGSNTDRLGNRLQTLSELYRCEKQELIKTCMGSLGKD